MAIAWINLSTRWSLTSVQAALNVIISILGTIGIWAFSRFWWQQGSTNVLHHTHGAPLSALLSVAGPGDVWDAVRVLRRQIFARENGRLLIQLCVVIFVSLACMFAGPIAKASLRSTRTVHVRTIQVLQTSKSDGFLGDRTDADVQWNDTMQSLNEAQFPYNQLLDYLPATTEPWTYVEREWDPTWSAACTFHEEKRLEYVTATGNGSFTHPLDAFPAFRLTYDPSWLDTSKYRIQADCNAETVYTEQDGLVFKDAIFWVLIQSEPQTNDRMYTNNETLQISISAFHAKNFRILTYNDATQAGVDTWRPIGSVENASFARVECNMTRESEVLDENAIPWVWTNDTYSITFAYRTNWMTEVGEKSSKNLTVTTPTPQELFRFYQAYMVSVNTWLSHSSLREVSKWMDTVQLSVVLLALILILTLGELWLTGRYLRFLRRHKQELERMSIPDGKMEWMIHAAKLASQGVEEEIRERKRAKDRDYFCTASFGNTSDAEIEPPELARVYTKRTSASGTTHSSIRRSDTSQRPRSVVDFPSNQENARDTTKSGKYDLEQSSSPMTPGNGMESAISSGPAASQSPHSRERSIPQTDDGGMSNRLCSGTSTFSVGKNQSPSKSALHPHPPPPPPSSPSSGSSAPEPEKLGPIDPEDGVANRLYEGSKGTRNESKK